MRTSCRFTIDSGLDMRITMWTNQPGRIRSNLWHGYQIKETTIKNDKIKEDNYRHELTLGCLTFPKQSENFQTSETMDNLQHDD